MSFAVFVAAPASAQVGWNVYRACNFSGPTFQLCPADTFELENTAVGTSSDLLAVFIQNLTGSPGVTMRVTEVAVLGQDAAEFSVENGCAGRDIRPTVSSIRYELEDCGLTLRWMPLREAGQRQVQLRISVTFADTQVCDVTGQCEGTGYFPFPAETQEIDLSGLAIGLAFSPTIHATKNTPVVLDIGKSGPALSMTVQTNVAAGVTLHSVTMTRSGDPSHPAYDSLNFSSTCAGGSTLQAGATCSLSMSYQARSTVATIGTITIVTSDPGSPYVITVSAAGRIPQPNFPSAMVPRLDQLTYPVVAPGVGGCLPVADQSGPFEGSSRITRFVGETDSTGSLLRVAQMKANQVVSPFVTIEVFAFLVSGTADGQPVGVPAPAFSLEVNGNSAFLPQSHVQGFWHRMRFNVPTEQFRFPTRGDPELGTPPTGPLNELILRQASTSSNEPWCSSLGAWRLSFNAMSPIVLLHCNGCTKLRSLGGHYSVFGFQPFLESINLPSDDSIFMEPDLIYDNVVWIELAIGKIVRSFGTDVIHLVGHSKGGLHGRAWLEQYYPRHRDGLLPPRFRVASLTTYSTPHRGSAAADLQVAWGELSKGERAFQLLKHLLPSDLSDLGEPLEDFLGGVGALVTGVNDGKWDLTTDAVQNGFNPKNVPLLPNDVRYFAFRADADLNADGHLECSAILDDCPSPGTGVIYTDYTPEVALALGIPAEWAHLTVDDEKLADVAFLSRFGAASIVDIPYQLLRDARAVEVDTHVVSACLPGLGCKVLYRYEQIGVREGGGDLNDVAVTLPSGGGPPGGPFVAQPPFVGVTPTAGRRVPGRNHMSVIDGAAAQAGLPLWRQAERRPR